MMLSFNIAWAGYPYYVLHAAIQNKTNKTVVIKDLLMVKVTPEQSYVYYFPLFKGVVLKPNATLTKNIDQRKLLREPGYPQSTEWSFREILIGGKHFMNKSIKTCNLTKSDYIESFYSKKPAVKIVIKNYSSSASKPDYGYVINPLVSSSCTTRMRFDEK
jgi:hypothetical protein